MPELSIAKWRAILTLHPSPVVRCYAAWALAQRWSTLDEATRNDVFFLAITDPNATLGMSGCMFITSSPAHLLSTRIDGGVPEAQVTEAARRLRSREAWIASIQRKFDRKAAEEAINYGNEPFIEPQDWQNALEKRVATFLSWNEVLFFEDEDFNLSELASTNLDRFEEIVLAEFDSMLSIPPDQWIGLVDSDNTSPQHFSLYELQFVVQEHPRAAFKESLLRVASAKHILNRASDACLRALLPYCLDDDDALEKVIELIKLSHSSWTRGAIFDTLDDFILAHANGDSLSNLASRVLVRHRPTDDKDISTQLSAEALQHYSHWRRFDKLIDFVVSSWNKYTFPAVSVMKYLLIEKRSVFTHSFIVESLSETTIGSEVTIGMFISAVMALEDTQYREFLLRSAVDGVRAAANAWNGLMGAYPALLTTHLCEEIAAEALSYATQTAPSSEWIDMLHVLRFLLVSQADAVGKLLATEPTDDHAVVVASIIKKLITT